VGFYILMKSIYNMAHYIKVNKETKQKAAEAITEKATEFQIVDNGKTYNFFMSGLKLQTLIDISAETSKLTLHNQKASPAQVIASMQNDAEIQAKIIALAVINCKDANDTTKRLFPWFKKAIEPETMSLPQLTKFFLKTLDSEQLLNLSNLVKEKTGYTDFFLSTVSLRGINLLEKTVTADTDQPAQSGDE
jgi:hypothetical protein